MSSCLSIPASHQYFLCFLLILQQASAQNDSDEEAAEEFLATYDDKYGKLGLAWDYETIQLKSSKPSKFGE